MKFWLKTTLSKSEEFVDTEPLACTDLVCYDYFAFFGSQTTLSYVAGNTYQMVKQNSLGRLDCFQRRILFSSYLRNWSVQSEERLNMAFRRSVTSPLEGGAIKGVTLNWTYEMIFSETLMPQKLFWWSTLHTIFIWDDGIFGFSGRV